MQVIEKPLDEIIPYARNPRNNAAAVSKVAASLKEYGWQQPIVVDSEMVIIAGHTRLLAAQQLGLSAAPVVVASDLSPEQVKAYRIADNRVSQEAEWDIDLLAGELKELSELDIDLALTGFDQDEIDGFIALGDAVEEGLTDEDDVPEVPVDPVTVEGDVWVLGNHRVMCGDSTSIDAVEKLMDGQKADMVFTDPPYNVGFNGRSGKFDVIKNDDLGDDEFDDLIDGMCQTIEAVSPKVYYVWCNWEFYGVLQSKLDYRACIVWAKNVFGMGVGYRHQHEFCLFNGKIDEFIKNESDLWQIKKDAKYMHPTQKPVELSVRAFGNHTKLLRVLDLFGGSGSTLIGAEQTGRTCYMMELDPKYCDVIIKRWQDFTGKQAIHADTGKPFDEISEAA